MLKKVVGEILVEQQIDPSISVAKWLDLSEYPEDRKLARLNSRSMWVPFAFLATAMVARVLIYFFYGHNAHTTNLVFWIAEFGMFGMCFLQMFVIAKRIPPSGYLQRFPMTPTAERARVEILQDGVITGIDWGYVWIENGVLCFSGRQSSFAIPKCEIRGRSPRSWWREWPQEILSVTFSYRLNVPERTVDLRIGLADWRRKSLKKGIHPFDAAMTMPETSPPTREVRQFPPLDIAPNIKQGQRYWGFVARGVGRSVSFSSRSLTFSSFR